MQLKRRIQNTVEHLRWSFFAISDSILNTPLPLLRSFGVIQSYLRQSIQEWTNLNLWKTAFKRFEHG